MTEQPKHVISPDQITDALRRSGYLLESRIDSLVRKRGYHVCPNVSHVDPITGKAREIDLHALRALRAGKGTKDFVWPVFLIECINSPQPIAFFTKSDPVAFMRRELIQVAGSPVRFLTGKNEWTDVPEAIQMDEYHHYCRGKVATQFCSFSEKKGGAHEWFAQHVPDHFGSFAKLLDAVHASANELADCWIDAGDARHEDLNIEFIYPILVVSGSPLYDVVQGGKNLKVAERGHFLYRASGVRTQQVVDYLVDVVSEAAFPKFLTLVDREMKTTAERFLRKSDVVIKSLRRIYNIAKRTRSASDMRHLMQLPSVRPLREL